MFEGEEKTISLALFLKIAIVIERFIRNLFQMPVTLYVVKVQSPDKVTYKWSTIFIYFNELF